MKSNDLENRLVETFGNDLGNRTVTNSIQPEQTATDISRQHAGQVRLQMNG